MTIGWSLWVRRVTWCSRWEAAATLNIALQGCALALASPSSSATLGAALHRLTGRWNVEVFLAHDCYIVAAAALLYHALIRLADDETVRESFRQYVEQPVTLCIPLLLAAFALSNRTDRPAGGWLAVYWVLLAGLLVYLLGFALRALLILLIEPAARAAQGRFAVIIAVVVQDEHVVPAALCAELIKL